MLCISQLRINGCDIKSQTISVSLAPSVSCVAVVFRCGEVEHLQSEVSSALHVPDTRVESPAGWEHELSFTYSGDQND